MILSVKTWNHLSVRTWTWTSKHDFSVTIYQNYLQVVSKDVEIKD